MPPPPSGGSSGGGSQGGGEQGGGQQGGGSSGGGSQGGGSWRAGRWFVRWRRVTERRNIRRWLRSVRRRGQRATGRVPDAGRSARDEWRRGW
jgi:hypothetical protein